MKLDRSVGFLVILSFLAGLFFPLVVQSTIKTQFLEEVPGVFVETEARKTQTLASPDTTLPRNDAHQSVGEKVGKEERTLRGQHHTRSKAKTKTGKDTTTDISNDPSTTTKSNNETKADKSPSPEDRKTQIASLLEKGIYKSRKELLGRSKRFPSVDKRAQVYLSSWYIPPCNDNERIPFNFVKDPVNKTSELVLLREFARSPETPPRTFVTYRYPARFGRQLGKVTHGDPATLRGCRKCNHYIPDAVDYILPAWDRLVERNKSSYDMPLLFFWGDFESKKGHTKHPSKKQLMATDPHFPIIQKYRKAVSWNETNKVSVNWMAANKNTCRPEDQVPPPVSIVAMMKSLRHYGPIEKIPELDKPWQEKKNAAVWRGSVRGVINDFKMSELRNQSALDRCMQLPRCRLVYNAADRDLIDAGMVGNFHEGLVPENINGTTIYKESMDKGQMLNYKAVIMLEGNDVSTGLKWALFSNSVVMMPVPTRTSWAMEELLEPWIHYIPLSVTLDDVEEKMQWVVDHDKEAEEIARRGKLWMTDMLHHPDSKRDEELIYEEIVLRFQSHFVRDSSLTL